MPWEILLVVVVIGIGLVILAVNIRKWISETAKPTENTALIEWLKSMQQSIELTNKTLHDSLRGSNLEMNKVLQENSKSLNERLDNAARVISAVQKNLGEMSEVGKGIKTLQEFLQSPKLRGGLGEQVLNDMIGQTFPKNAFHLQYSFKSGTKVDAVLKTDAGLLCIDSKFPMENFNLMLKGDTELERTKAKREFVSDVKKHINDISKKYILPDEGTTDFALMYIPSESVYYEVANSSEITEFARKLRVYPVSPNTLYAHLQVLLLSFQGKEMESKSKQIFALLRGIQKDYSKVEENLSVLNRHVTNAHNQLGNVSATFSTLGQKLSQSNNLAQEENNMQLEK